MNWLEVDCDTGARCAIELVRLPPGTFEMGSADGLPFAPEGPIHTVHITRAFWMARVQVTQGSYAAITGVNPASFQGDPQLPVESVTWDEAVAFCERLSRLSGREVRLPNEAEWEYAYRAGTRSSYFFGEDANQLTQYAWFEDNSGGQTHCVGRKLANPWGLHDMAGNVWEWCSDVWHPDFEGAPTDGSAWTAGAERQHRRCVRGGSWDMDRFRLRASYRSFDFRDTVSSRLGFRIAVTGEQGETS